ncbi:SGNH/GDSL hydrolase family protein, partial [Sphingomonas bacterium]|uniref:SGNH/GDSL hydrolase family protein n=1 Tax=Sphingomonas bacterium TaxID=1895847 RepID=UPI0015765660
ALWDPATLALADGAAVTSWTDAVGGAVARQTGDSGASHSFVASSGGLPAVRLSGAAVLATAGANAANAAMTGGERAIMVVARAIQTAGAGQVNPVLVASGDGTGLLLQATPTQTGRYGSMYDCADAGMRTIGWSGSGARQFWMDGINGSAVATTDQAGGQITIGGWKNAGSLSGGRADILAVIVFNRAITAADFKQVHRRYCELLGQARPGGAARIVSMLGDSLTAGYPVGVANSYQFQLKAGLGLAWGSWDALGVAGFTMDDLRNRTLPSLGDTPTATGTRNIVCAFEWANQAQYVSSAPAQTIAAARSFIDALTAVSPGIELLFGTSTDRGDGFGQAHYPDRVAYNAFWDTAANRAGITTLVKLHLDASIGVQGVAPTTGAANTYYQADSLHLQTAGYGLIDDGPNGFRPAVQARLAA